jgi:molybdopterin-containing oxidoreductase family membrane subunit
MDSAKLKKFFWGAGGLLLFLGLFGWWDRLTWGHRHANYGSVVTWGLWVAMYIYCIGLSAGAFLISSLVYVFGMKRFEGIAKLALFTALVTLIMALLSIWADLGHMNRAWHVNVYPNFKSPMAWMIWLYSAYFLLLGAEFYYAVRADLAADLGKPVNPAKFAGDEKKVRVLASIGIPLAIMFHGGVGALFGVVSSRPHWHGGLFPILFLLSALVSGGALLTCIAAVFQDGWQKNSEIIKSLGGLVLGLLLLDVLFQISEYLTAFYSGNPEETAGHRLVLVGRFWYVFWIWQVAAGTLVPILILSFKRLRDDARWVAFAGLLIALGFMAVRLNIVIPAMAVEEIRSLSESFLSPRYSTAYFPSVHEWLLAAGVLGLGMILFGLGERFLPLVRAVPSRHSGALQRR